MRSSESLWGPAVRRAPLICLLVFACAALLSACGSDSNSGDSTATTSTESGSTTAASQTEEEAASQPEEEAGGEAAEGEITNYVDYTHGTAGAADSSLEPVTLGYMNNEGGQLSFPSGTTGAEAAVEYVNEKLGGIDGHPLALKKCIVTTSEEEGQSCAYDFVADDAVKATLFGMVPTGSQAYLAANRGKKPVLIGNSLAPGEATAANLFILSSSSATLYGAAATYAKDTLKATSGAIIAPNGVPQLDVVQEQFDKAGIDTKVVTYDSGAADILGPLTASGAQSADFIMAVPSDPAGCVLLAKGLQTLNIDAPVLMVGGDSCFTPGVSQALGGDTPEWINLGAHAVLTDEANPEIAAYVDAASEVGISKKEVLGDGFFQNTWTLVMTSARILNEAKGAETTSKEFATKLKEFTGPLVLGAPELHCGVVPNEPNVCGYQSLLIKEGSEGQSERVGGWVSPPGIE